MIPYRPKYKTSTRTLKVNMMKKKMDIILRILSDSANKEYRSYT